MDIAISTDIKMTKIILYIYFLIIIQYLKTIITDFLSSSFKKTFNWFEIKYNKIKYKKFKK